jgi:molybdopterin converting factor small subunit
VLSNGFSCSFAGARRHPDSHDHDECLHEEADTEQSLTSWSAIEETRAMVERLDFADFFAQFPTMEFARLKEHVRDVKYELAMQRTQEVIDALEEQLKAEDHLGIRRHTPKMCQALNKDTGVPIEGWRNNHDQLALFYKFK